MSSDNHPPPTFMDVPVSEARARIGGSVGAWVVALLGLLTPTAVGAQISLTALPTRSAELELSLGAFDDPVLAFSRISDLTVDSVRRLYVLQPIEGMATVLERDGALYRRIGRKGQGPGEFLAPAAAGWRADTLWVMDAAQERVSMMQRSTIDATWLSGSLAVAVGIQGCGPIPAADQATVEMTMAEAWSVQWPGKPRRNPGTRTMSNALRTLGGEA